MCRAPRSRNHANRRRVRHVDRVRHESASRRGGGDRGGGAAGAGRHQQRGPATGSPGRTVMQCVAPTAVALPVEGTMPSLTGSTAWLNTPQLSVDGLRGKVVLVDFWTYSCINWRRQLPYVRAWAAKYGEHGLVVIGVHSPEFAFEKNVGNVRWA